MSNNDMDNEVCKKIDSLIDKFEERIEKETGCTVEGFGICFTIKGNDYQHTIHTGPYENIEVMGGKTVDVTIE
ncbi:hypothetical protein [Methanococcus sp. CF]